MANLLLLSICAFIQLLPNLASLVPIEMSVRHSLENKFGRYARFSRLLDSRRLKTVSSSISELRRLPEPIIRKAVQLYNKGQMEQLLSLLTAVERLEQLYRLQKCSAIFSYQLCSNSSAQPFFLWAKMSANQLTNGRRYFKLYQNVKRLRDSRLSPKSDKKSNNNNNGVDPLVT